MGWQEAEIRCLTVRGAALRLEGGSPQEVALCGAGGESSSVHPHLASVRDRAAAAWLGRCLHAARTLGKEGHRGQAGTPRPSSQARVPRPQRTGPGVCPAGELAWQRLYSATSTS